MNISNANANNVAKILQNNGKLLNQTLPFVYSFIDLEGKESFSAFAHVEHDDMKNSTELGVTLDPKLLMTDCMLTEEGKKWLELNGYDIPEKKPRIMYHNDVHNAVLNALEGDPLFYDDRIAIANKTCELLDLTEDHCPICGFLYKVHSNSCGGEDSYEPVTRMELLAAFSEARLIVQFGIDEKLLNKEIIKFLDYLD